MGWEQSIQKSTENNSLERVENRIASVEMFDVNLNREINSQRE